MKEFITDLLTKINKTLSNTLKIDFGNTYYVSEDFSFGDLQGDNISDNWTASPSVNVFLNNDIIITNQSSFLYIPQKNNFIKEKGNLFINFEQETNTCPVLIGNLELAEGLYNINIIFEGISSTNGSFSINGCNFSGYNDIPILGMTKDLSKKQVFIVNDSNADFDDRQLKVTIRDNTKEKIITISESDFQNALKDTLYVTWYGERAAGGYSQMGDPTNGDTNYMTKTTFYKNINFYHNDDQSIDFILPLPCFLGTNTSACFCSLPNISLIINKIK